jgi:hypothetical protein
MKRSSKQGGWFLFTALSASLAALARPLHGSAMHLEEKVVFGF